MNNDTRLHSPLWEPLDWDSNFLGYRVARFKAENLCSDELHELIISGKLAGLRLLYLIVSPDDVRSNLSANRAGALLADRKVTFRMLVAPETAHHELSKHIRPTTQVTASLETLALQSGEYSRFRLDPKFDSTVFPHLYGTWLRNSLTHELAREVLMYASSTDVLTFKDKALGFITIGLKHSRVDIGLLAVHEQSRGQRIGQQLVQAAKQRTAAWGLSELQVVTQLDNVRACHFYQKCGFQSDNVEHIYHLWI